jgi:hypothetical protein
MRVQRLSRLRTDSRESMASFNSPGQLVTTELKRVPRPSLGPLLFLRQVTIFSIFCCSSSAACH